MARHRPPKHELEFDKIVTVVVGQNPPKYFYIHPAILSNRSKFFAAALDANWRKEGKPIELPEVDPHTFNQYLTWSYTGKLDIEAATAMLEEEAEQKCAFADLYHLGNYLDDKELRNQVIDGIIDAARAWGNRPGLSTIKAAFGPSASPNSMLCRLLLDNYQCGTDPTWMEWNIDRLPSTFTRQLLFGWAAASSDPNLTYPSLMTTSK